MSSVAGRHGDAPEVALRQAVVRRACGEEGSGFRLKKSCGRYVVVLLDVLVVVFRKKESFAGRRIVTCGSSRPCCYRFFCFRV